MSRFKQNDNDLDLSGITIGNILREEDEEKQSGDFFSDDISQSQVDSFIDNFDFSSLIGVDSPKREVQEHIGPFRNIKDKRKIERLSKMDFLGVPSPDNFEEIVDDEFLFENDNINPPNVNESRFDKGTIAGLGLLGIGGALGIGFGVSKLIKDKKERERKRKEEELKEELKRIKELQKALKCKEMKKKGKRCI